MAKLNPSDIPQINYTKKFRSEYNTWADMKHRCLNPKRNCYARYGGRGISICERWLECRAGFKNFLLDMGTKPTPEHELDRIDNNGNYCPENCRWATCTQQSRNRRSNRLETYNDETLCLAEWAERFGLPRRIVEGRLNLGWDIHRTLTTPVDKTGKVRMNNNLITHNGRTMCITDWTRELGFKYTSIIKDRLASGWSFQEIIDTPPKKNGPVLITYKGETHNLREWSKILGVKYKTLAYRIVDAKLSMEEALSRPFK